MDDRKDMTMAGKDLEEEITAFLNDMANKPGGKRTKPGCNVKHGKGCALGTCIDNEPRVTPIDFFNEGTTIWIAGQPGGKIANIMRNPKVSVGIYEPVDHSIEQKSLQVWGTAELINIKNNPEEFRNRMESFGVNEAASGVIEELVQMGTIPPEQKEKALEMGLKQFNLIKIKPLKMVLLHMRPGRLPLKKIWENGKATVKAAGV
jgi:nitroimidazol reductase NimA-like FMN-containing flavoprotein (pyridoxamine 5'-phosphate oxidase superfamily)